MPAHLIPPLAALIVVALLALKRAPPAVMLVALALIFTAASLAGADTVASPEGESVLEIRFPVPPLYTFLVRWASMSVSAIVWAVLATLALLHHFGAGPTGRRIMGVAVAGLLLSQTVSPFLAFAALAQPGMNSLSGSLSGFELVNPVFVLIGIMSLILFFGNFLLMPFMMRSDRPPGDDG